MKLTSIRMVSAPTIATIATKVASSGAIGTDCSCMWRNAACRLALNPSQNRLPLPGSELATRRLASSVPPTSATNRARVGSQVCSVK